MCDVGFMTSSVDLFVDRLCATSVICHLSCVAITRNNNLWITQTVAPCENRIGYTSHHTKQVVKVVSHDN
ncbi:hypothetical protein SFRURICE_005137 [Spodoptera frugiperda]|nr:hypothetical protein SFRURICE_005137 [Spodoptera frugiperda]